MTLKGETNPSKLNFDHSDLIHVGVHTEPDPNDPKWDQLADQGGSSFRQDYLRNYRDVESGFINNNDDGDGGNSVTQQARSSS